MPRKPTTPWKHAVMAQRRADAEARQAAYQKLTPQERLDRLNRANHRAVKERAKLATQIGKVA
jgi:hypothetical protein